MPISKEKLLPNAYYWARRVSGGEMEVVQISTIFGEGLDYMSVAVLGSDQHHSLTDFEFISEIAKADDSKTAEQKNVVTFPELKRLKS